MGLMSRPFLAAIGGVLGFLAYVAAVVVLADHVLAMHWLVQFAYFVVAGTVWAWPARALILWAARTG